LKFNQPDYVLALVAAFREARSRLRAGDINTIWPEL
jgi:hypothetical protein